MPPRRRNRGGDTFYLNLTPLLDVVLQLITFFMMLIHFGTRIEGATDAVRLPVAPAALPGADLRVDRLVVVIDEAGRLRAGSEARDGAAARAWWDLQATRRRAGLAVLGEARPSELATEVVVRADRDAAYGAVRGALAQAQAAGFARFALV